MPKLFSLVGLQKRKKKREICIFVFIRPWFLI